MKNVKVTLPRIQNIHLAAYNPATRYWRLFIGTIFFVVSAYGFYWLGSNGYQLPEVVEDSTLGQLRAELQEANRLNKKLRQDVAQLSSSTSVDLLAADQITQTLHEKELEILKLNEELIFYKTLLAPEVAGLGLEVKDFSVRSSTEKGEFYYDLLLTQSNRSKSVAKGKVNLVIDGKQEGVNRRLALKDIVEQPLDSIEYSFKYFQRLNGVFALPTNFKPQQLMLELDPANDAKKSYQISYSWRELVSGS
jgi:hypothetical protein